MSTLHTLKNTSRVEQAPKRRGRGQGSKLGKTCGRGQKGAGARSGYKRRWGKEGGQMPLFMKLPIRGFSNAYFRREFDVVNLTQIEFMYEDGEVVNLQTLKDRGFLSGRSHGLKILGTGDLTKKVTIQADTISKSAQEKLAHAKIKFEVKSA
jgi:large subunit ribosomal protein L15